MDILVGSWRCAFQGHSTYKVKSTWEVEATVVDNVLIRPAIPTMNLTRQCEAKTSTKGRICHAMPTIAEQEVVRDMVTGTVAAVVEVAVEQVALAPRAKTVAD